MWSEFRRVKFAVATLFCAAILIGSPALASDGAWRAALLRDHPLAGKIYDTAKARFVSQDELLKRITSVRHILLGEIHDNAEHHLYQGVILRRATEHARRPVAVLEMLTEQHGDLVARLNAVVPDGAQNDALRNELGAAWKKAGWPDISTYAPVFRAVRSGKVLLSIGEPAPAADATVAQLLKVAPLNPRLSSILNEELKTSHCGVLPEHIIPKIAVAQRKRDIKLALAMQAAHIKGGDGTVLIAGSGHARKDRGVPHYLRHLGEESVTLNFREVEKGKTDPSDLIEPGEADYIWFTPRHQREDPCIALRKRFGKSKK